MQIPLTKKQVAIISPEDADLAARKWTAFERKRPRGTFYAYRKIDNKTALLHRVVAGRMGILADGLVIDHVNGDGLDNRRENLRAVPQRINSFNRQGDREMGVGPYRDGRWRARIGRKNLGYFANKEDAIAARLEAERQTWGLQPRRAEAHA